MPPATSSLSPDDAAAAATERRHASARDRAAGRDRTRAMSRRAGRRCGPTCSGRPCRPGRSGGALKSSVGPAVVGDPPADCEPHRRGRRSVRGSPCGPRGARRLSAAHRCGSRLVDRRRGHVSGGHVVHAAALQARMLTQAGLPPAAVGTGLTAGALLLLGALAGLPLLALPAVLLGQRVPDGLLQAAGVGLAVFAVLFAVGASLLANDRVLRALGRGLRAADMRLRRGRGRIRRIAAAAVRRARRGAPVAGTRVASGGGPGGRTLDLRLPVSLRRAAGGRGTAPAVVALLAYSAAALLGQLPLTPGGLGVVEAGLTGTLALAGVAAAPAALATLPYRLTSYWLPLPVGLAAWMWHRRRYASARAAMPRRTPSSSPTPMAFDPTER